MSTTEDRQSRKIEDIRLILKDLLKVIKVVSIYPEDNPLPQSMRRTFAERLVDLVADYGQLDFGVGQEEVFFEGEAVFTDRSREESLAGLFFETGIIRITFKPNLEVEEVYRLLDAVKAYQNSDRRTSDLAAILWEAGLQQFSFETVEDVALRQYDGDLLIQGLTDPQPDSSDYEQTAGGGPDDYEAIFRATEDQAASTEDAFVDADARFENSFLVDSENRDPAGSVLSTGDEELDSTLKVTEAVEAMGLSAAAGAAVRTPDTNLILNDELKLSDEEMEQVGRLVTRDAEFVEYESTCELLKELLHQEAEMTDFYESVTICEKVLMEFVIAGKLTFAADLLRYMQSLEQQLQKDKPLWAERLKDTRVTTGSRDRLAILCQALNESEEIGSMELRRYLDNFDWEALMGITDMLGDLKHELHRSAVKDYLTFRGKDRVPIVAKGIYDKRTEVVAASATILAGIGTTQALQQLGKIANHRELEVRRAMVAGLATCPNDDCLSLLRQLVNDDDSTVHREAVRAIVERRGQPAFDTLTEIVNDDRFFRLGQDDQRSLLIAYSTLGGDMAVDFLVRLGEKVNMFKNQSLAFYREAAFEALAHNRGEKAERVLVKLSGNWRADIKAHAKKALQRRRELIYGDSDD